MLTSAGSLVEGEYPPLNLRRKHPAFVELQCPGMDRRSVAVTVAGDTLTIGCAREWERSLRCLRRERPFGRFIRHVRFSGERLEAARIVARYADGILRVDVVRTRAPATSEAMPREPSEAGRLPATARSDETATPLVDIGEDDEAFVILADVPGVKPGGVETTIDGGELAIRGRNDRGSSAAELREFVPDDFYRRCPLARGVDASAREQTLRDGVLRVVIPKNPAVDLKTGAHRCTAHMPPA